MIDIGSLNNYYVIIHMFSILAAEKAYLDPGSESYFIQILLASLMGALFALGVYRRKVSDFFKKPFNKNESDEDLDE